MTKQRRKTINRARKLCEDSAGLRPRLFSGLYEHAIESKPTRGGKREGAGRKPAADPAKHRGIRCTDGGWQWLKDQASKAGASSIGKWADMKGNK